MAGLPPKLDAFLGGLRLLEDRADRIQFLISVADRYREVPPEVARRPFSSDRQVPNCESEAYVWALEQPNGTLRFHFAVENPQGISAKAMAAILEETVSGLRPEEVLGLPADLPYEIFGSELSMGKTMGLMGLVAMVRASAKRALEVRAGR